MQEMKGNETLIDKLEKAGLVTVIIIWLLRVWLGPVLNFALLVTTTLLAVYYLWFGFFIFNGIQPLDLLQRHVRQMFNPFRITTSILMGFIMSYLLIAILFGFYFFPGSPAVMASAFGMLMAFMLALLFFYFIKRREVPHGRKFYIRTGLLLVGLLMLWLPPVEDRLNLLYREYPEFVEAYMEHMESPECPDAEERLREERSRFR